MEKILDVFERKNMERSVLKAFALEGLNPESLASLEQADEIAERVLKRLETSRADLMPVSMDIEKDEEESKYYIDVKSRRNGLSRRTLIDFDLTESPSFAEIVSITERIGVLGQPPFDRADG